MAEQQKYGGGAEKYARFKQYDYRAVSDLAHLQRSWGAGMCSMRGGGACAGQHRQSLCVATVGAMQQQAGG